MRNIEPLVVVEDEPPAGPLAPGLDVHTLHEKEVTLLRDTINQLLGTIKAHKQESDRSDAFAILIKQLREANQHLVLANFGAQDLAASAEAANLRQTEFLSMLAHELRNPLQPIAMANSLLSNITDMHPHIGRVHDVVERQVAHMARLVDDLLDASRVSSGKITLKIAPVLLGDVIAGAIETAQPGIDRRHQQLSVDLPSVPIVIEGDLVRLAQVFSNLLINASKFTHEHGHIGISAKRTGNRVEIAVNDDGAGVALDIQPFIFDLFTQGFHSLDRAQGGLGIGLSLVRTITQLHGGSAVVVSRGAGLGSRFVVTLPLSELTLTADGPDAVVDRPLPRRILLIEDNVDANEMLAVLLRNEGHLVTSCFDGPSGLRTGLDQTFDVVVCDIGLPGMDGYQVVSALRSALSEPLPCFIATTGYSQAGQLDHARHAGFDHYLVKPIPLVALFTIVAAQPVPVHGHSSPAT